MLRSSRISGGCLVSGLNLSHHVERRRNLENGRLCALGRRALLKRWTHRTQAVILRRPGIASKAGGLESAAPFRGSDFVLGCIGSSPAPHRPAGGGGATGGRPRQRVGAG